MGETRIHWIMLILVVTILCGIHAFIYHTFFYKTNTNSQSFGIYFCIALLAFNFLFLLDRFFYFSYPIEFLSSLAVGISFLLFSGALLYYLCLSPFYLLGTQTQIQHFSPYIRYIALSLSILGIVLSIYNGLFVKPVLKTISLDINNLQKPIKVLQVSDLHISTLTNKKNLEDLIVRINNIQPDIIVLTGDIIDSNTKYIAQKIKLLSFLRARYGVFYVLGNHEYYHDTQNILDQLKDNNIVILNNTSSTIFDTNGRALINIIGITDYTGNSLGFLKPDLNTAILKRDPEAPSILLSHQPKVIQELSNLKVNPMNLILSGHTHGGQIFPFNFLVLLQQPFVKGLHKLGENSQVYVSQGSGTWGPPMRLGTQSEVTLFYLMPTNKTNTK